MATIQYTVPNSIETPLSTGLNSLASANGAASATISNDGSGEHYLWADFELYIAAQGSARSTGASVDLFLLPIIDGSNPSYGGTTLKPSAGLYVGSFMLDAATTARYCHLMRIPLPGNDFQVFVWNSTGQAFAASGSTVKMSRYKLDAS